MHDVITVGSATIDAFARTEAELIEIRTDRTKETLIAYPSGTKILIDKLNFHTGGGGTNTAVGFSRLGLKTAFLGRLGNDANAKLVLDELKKENVDFIGHIGSGKTGYSVVLDSVEDDRTILTFKGANNSLRWEHVKRPLSAKWLYLTSMIGESWKTQKKLAAYAKSRGIKVGYNPSSYIARQGTGYLSGIMKSVDLLILNLEEAEYLVGKNPVNETLRNLSVLIPGTIVITDGRNGVFAYDGKMSYRMAANRVRVKETTGAGDAFASGFLAGLIHRGDISYALGMGMANATSVITHLGAKNRLLSLREARAQMRKNRRVTCKKLSFRA